MFYAIHDWMVDGLGLRRTDLQVYALIYSYVASGYEFTGSLVTIARRTGTGRTSVYRALKRLTERGLLIREETGAFCRYSVNQECIQNEYDRVHNETVRVQNGTVPNSKMKHPPFQNETPHVSKWNDPVSKRNSTVSKMKPNNKDNKEYIKGDIKESNKGDTPHTQNTPRGRYENVFLSDREYLDLINEFSQEKTQDYIERLSLHMASKGKTYASHDATIRSWILNDNNKNNNSSLSDVDRLLISMGVGSGGNNGY